MEPEKDRVDKIQQVKQDIENYKLKQTAQKERETMQPLPNYVMVNQILSRKPGPPSSRTIGKPKTKPLSKRKSTMKTLLKL